MKNISAFLLYLFLASMSIESAVAPVMKSVKISGIAEDDPYPSKRTPLAVSGAKILLLSQIQISTVNPPNAQLAPYQTIGSTETDQQGKFSFQPVQAGNYSISAAHADFIPRRISFSCLSDTSVRISMLALGAHASLNGKVMMPCHEYMTESDCPMISAPGCTVSLLSTGIAMPGASELMQSKTVTNAAGQFSFDSIPLDINNKKVEIMVKKAGFTTKIIDTALWNTQALALSISLASRVLTADTVITNPEKPTENDSILFRLFNFGLSCCAPYHGNYVSISDTNIYLSFTPDESNAIVCDCMGNGSWTTFKTGPIAKGLYSIYKVQMHYCVAEICPDVKVAPVRVGAVSVSKSTAIIPTQAQPATKELSIRLATNKKELVIESPQNVIAVIAAYGLRGELLVKPLEKSITNGSCRISMTDGAAGFMGGKALVVTVSLKGKAAQAKLLRLR